MHIEILKGNDKKGIAVIYCGCTKPKAFAWADTCRVCLSVFPKHLIDRRKTINIMLDRTGMNRNILRTLGLSWARKGEKKSNEV